MKQLNLLSALLILGIFSSFAVDIPKSNDLTETGKHQRRDLSMPMSRIVLNFFDFNSRQIACEYSNRPSMPVNAAYLSTDKNIPGSKPSFRFSRSVQDLLTMHCTSDYTELLNDKNLGVATSFSTKWTPHSLPYNAMYKEGMTINGVDFLYDLNTIVRTINISEKTTRLCFAGQYQGNITEENGVITVINNNINYAIAFSEPVTGFSFNENRWSVRLAQASKNKTITVSIAFAGKNEINILNERTKKPIVRNDVKQALNKREKFWDSFLEKVPHPHNFDLTLIDSKGVKGEDIRYAYYKAWVFTCQNIIPGEPGVYPFPQIATGKASLWDEGETRAPFSAAWESFIGIQLYSYIDPSLSWEAFKGLMTLIDDEGVLGGESLPSRKAQTALLLYKITGDKKSLEEVYPSISRYLNWRMQIVHWVYGDMHATKTLKDAEFAFSALSDLQYMIEIAGILGKGQDAEKWKNKFDKLGKESLGWFWETPRSFPQQYYSTDTRKRSKGNTVWITTNLHVKGYLKGEYLKSTISLFDSNYNTDEAFAGFRIPKYPDVSYTVYGLLEHKMPERALGTMEACLRDIVRGHAAFAEQYTLPDFTPDGVRPSLFGSSIVIDFVLMANGYMLGDCTPQAILFPDKKGGVSGLRINRNIYNLSTGSQSGIVKWSTGKETKIITKDSKNPFLVKLDLE